MTETSAATVAPPWALLAELTHGCPLHCAYCSNPLELVRRSAELRTDEWADVMRQAGSWASSTPTSPAVNRC